MRARLTRLAPEFCRVYGLRPWELRRLTVAELDVFLAHHQALKEAENDGG